MGNGVGSEEGIDEGRGVGAGVGEGVGKDVGAGVGSSEGRRDGSGVGSGVGTDVGMGVDMHWPAISVTRYLIAIGVEESKKSKVAVRMQHTKHQSLIEKQVIKYISSLVQEAHAGP